MANLSQLWTKRNDQLELCKKVIEFEQQVLEVFKWLDDVGVVFLNHRHDYGRSLEEVRLRQDECSVFERDKMTPVSRQVDRLRSMMEQFEDAGHYELNKLRGTWSQLDKRWKLFEEDVKIRMNCLELSLSCQDNVFEGSKWCQMSEQLLQELEQKMSECDTASEVASLIEELTIYLSVTKEEQMGRVNKIKQISVFLHSNSLVELGSQVEASTQSMLREISAVKEELQSLHDKLVRIEEEWDRERRLIKLKERVLEEIVETEQIYTHDLRLIVEVCLPRYKSASQLSEGWPPSLKGKDHIVFGNVKAIKEYHAEELLPQVEEAAMDGLDSVAQVFVKEASAIASFYVPYCQNKTASDDLMASHRSYLSRVQSQLGIEDPLSSLLIKPLQRITKYPLLLKDALKYTTQLGQPTAILEQALEVVQEIPVQTNNAVHLSLLDMGDESTHKLGELIYQGIVMVSEPRLLLTVEKERRVFVFERAVVFSRRVELGQAKFKYEYKFKMALSSGVHIIDNMESEPCKFGVITSDHRIHLKAPTPVIKGHWVHALKIAAQTCHEEEEAARIRSLTMATRLHSTLRDDVTQDLKSKGGRQVQNSPFSSERIIMAAATTEDRPPSPAVAMYKVTMDYIPGDEDQHGLALKTGQVVEVLEQLTAANRCFVRSTGITGEIEHGWIPASLLEPDEQPAVQHSDEDDATDHGHLKQSRVKSVLFTDSNSQHPSKCHPRKVSPEQRERAQEKIKYIMAELVSTEKEYISKLEIIVTGFLHEMQSAGSALPEPLKGKEKMIFGNVVAIYEFHRDIFQHSLVEANDSLEKTAQCFLDSQKNFQLYVTYCENKPKSESWLWTYTHNGGCFFTDIQKKLGVREDIASFLIKPVHRVTKYRLLLKDLMKTAQKTGSPVPLLESAVQLMKDVPKQATHNATGLQNKSLVEKHIQQQGSVDLLSLKSFFIGPSCVGKTTALRRLTYKITHISPDDIVPSTGIDAPLTVKLYHETGRSSVLLSEHGWKSLGLREQCQTLCSHVINNPLPPPSSSSTLPMRPSLESTFSISPTTHHIDDPIDESTDEPVIDDDKPTDKPTGDMTDLITEISTLVKDEDWESIRELLKEKGIFTLLHIIDIGGQPECHEILPLLLHGLALNLIFLNVTQDLDSSYTVIYRDDDGYSPIQYKSEFTIREIIQRALCSIASLQTSPDHKPAAILVGTYFDQSSEADVLTLDQSIQKEFKDTNFMKNDILCQISESEEGERYIHPLNNVSSDPSDIEKLRQLITNTVHQRFTPEQVPTSTLLLHLILRQKFEVRGWCSIEECVEVAKSCHISREDLLGENGILQFLHDRFGTILYYHGLKIGQRVIINPNIILAPTTELFVSAFGAKKSEPKTAERIRTTGEIPQHLMDKVCSSKNIKKADEIPTSEIVELLASCYILYENTSEVCEKTTYFLPSLLFPDHNVAKESTDPTVLSGLFYSPILLCPSTDFCPLGLFPATVVNLSKREFWKLDKCNRFRNRIRFYVQYNKEKLLHVELRTLSTHLEFRILSTKPVNPRLIIQLRRELWDAVTKVSLFYPHTENVKWLYGFYCPHAVDSGDHPHLALCQETEEPQDVVCSLPDCHGGPVALEDRHKCWFMEIQMNTNHRKELNKSTDKPDPPLTVKELMAAVNNVSDWHALGIQLDLKMSQLNDIDVTYHKEGLKRIKAEMFSAWLKSSPSASWTDLIKALKAIGEDKVASQIEASCSGKSFDTIGLTVVSSSNEAIVGCSTHPLVGKETKSSAASTSKTVSEKTVTIAVEGTSAETSHKHQLSRLNLRRVVRAVRDYSDWRSLGLELGLDYQTLKSIQENNPGEKEACKMDMLKSWLDGEDEVTQCGGPTWQQLADCLRQLRQDALAENIEQEIYRE